VCVCAATCVVPLQTNLAKPFSDQLATSIDDCGRLQTMLRLGGTGGWRDHRGARCCRMMRRGLTGGCTVWLPAHCTHAHTLLLQPKRGVCHTPGFKRARQVRNDRVSTPTCQKQCVLLLLLLLLLLLRQNTSLMMPNTSPTPNPTASELASMDIAPGRACWTPGLPRGAATTPSGPGTGAPTAVVWPAIGSRGRQRQCVCVCKSRAVHRPCARLRCAATCNAPHNTYTHTHTHSSPPHAPCT
jgi:hypothetical protein